MSNQNEQEEPFLVVGPLTEILLEVDDCNNVIEFFEHFDLKVPACLKLATKDYISNQTLETQNAFRIALCEALIGGKEEIFKDEIFQLININTSKIVYEHNFTKQLEEVLGK